MIRACFVLVLLSAPALLAQSQKHASSIDNSAVYVELLSVPQKAAARRNPLENDPQATAAGAKLFERHCAECHGSTAQGSKKAPSLVTNEVQQASPGTLFWILTNGVVRRGMPVWSKLPEPQGWQLVTYLKSLRPAPKPPTVTSEKAQ